MPTTMAVEEEKKDDNNVKMKNPPGAGDDAYSDLVDEVRSGSSERKEAALAYLLRYETMVRQQEAEDMSVLAHMRPCMERLKELAGIKTDETFSLSQEISFVDLKKALDMLDSMEGNNNKNHEREFLTTDRQLMMILRLLTKDEFDYATNISWAEFIQCYKVCVSGMLTLQHLPPSSDDTSVLALRSRTRDRTMSMISLFEPSSTQLLTTNCSFSEMDSNRMLSTNSPASSATTSPSPPVSPRGAGDQRVLERVMSKRGKLLGVALLITAIAVLLVQLRVPFFPRFMVSNTKPPLASSTGGKPSTAIPKSTVPPFGTAYNTSPHYATTSPSVSPSWRQFQPRSGLNSELGNERNRGHFITKTSRYYPSQPAALPRRSSFHGYDDDVSSLSIFQHALGGALALPLSQFLVPNLAARLLTASVLSLVLMGAGWVVVATMTASILRSLRRWLFGTSSS